MSSLAAGMAYAWTSPSIPKLKSPAENPLTEELTTHQESWIAAFLPLGALLGALASGVLYPSIGKKRTLLIMIFPIILSNIIIALSCNINVFYFGRFLAGLTVGSSTAVVPIYLCEIAEIQNRGMIGCMFSTFMSIGILYSYVVGPYLDISTFSFSCLWPALIVYVVLPFIPDSVHYYLSKKEPAKALKVMSLLRINRKDVKEEFSQLCLFIEESKDNTMAKMLKERSFRRGLMICLTLIVFQQFSGISIIIFYMQTIFESAGSSMSAYASTVAVGSIQFLFCVLAVFVVDRLGRKVLLIISASGTAISLTTLGIYFYLKNFGYNIDHLYWLPITSILMHMASYNVGFGPVPFTILGEIFPPTAIASTLTSFTCLALTFITTKFFPTLVDSIGEHHSFWLLAAMMLLAIGFILPIVPETKGKSLKDIISVLEK